MLIIHEIRYPAFLITMTNIFLKACICECSEWFANCSQTVCKPNARMCGWDCKPVLPHLRTVRIPFAVNQNLLGFCVNTKRIGCTGCPLLASGSWKIN